MSRQISGLKGVAGLQLDGVGSYAVYAVGYMVFYGCDGLAGVLGFFHDLLLF